MRVGASTWSGLWLHRRTSEDLSQLFSARTSLCVFSMQGSAFDGQTQWVSLVRPKASIGDHIFYHLWCRCKLEGTWTHLGVFG